MRRGTRKRRKGRSEVLGRLVQNGNNEEMLLREMIDGN
jgi:hypothetical protein